MASVSKVMSQLKRFFEIQEIGYASEGEEVLWGTVYGELSNWQWVIRFCGQSNGIVSLRAGCPIKMPAERRAAVAEYLMRANWDLNFGNFEMDWSDGEVSFRTSIPASANGISVKAMTDLFYAPCGMMNHYLPGLLAVALANEEPAKAAAAASAARPVPGQESGAAEASAASGQSVEVPNETVDETVADKTTRLDRLFGSEN